MSDSLQTHGLYSPWNSPGQNTGVGSLQVIFPTQGSNPGLQHCKWILYQLSHKGRPRILEWVAYPFPIFPTQESNQGLLHCRWICYQLSYQGSPIIEVLQFSSEKAMAPHSSTLAWKIPWTEKPSRLQSRGCYESDTTERLHFYFSLSCTGEGNGNPLKYSFLENPRDRGAWWAAVYGVTQSWTQLKRLSSSSSSVQLLSRVQLFASPWTAANQASLSITNSRSPPKPMFIVSVTPSNHHILSSPSPPALNLSQHQDLFKWVSSSHQVAKLLEFQLQHQPLQWTPRTDLL